MSVLHWLYGKHYRTALILPILLVIAAVVIILIQVITTGDFINKGVTLKGGITLTANEPGITISDIETKLHASYPMLDATVRLISEAGQTRGFIIEAAGITGEELVAALAGIPAIDNDEYSLESMGPTLGQSFFRQVFIALILAFVFMSIVIFLYFRLLVPSLTIIAAALFDLIITIAALDLFGVTFSMAGIAALLMIIGYSIDTNIVLNVRVLKKRVGTVTDRIISAAKTGLTMTGTSLIGVLVAFIFSNSVVIKEIMLILVIGLVTDLIITWLFNAGVIHVYMTKHHITQPSVHQVKIK